MEKDVKLNKVDKNTYRSSISLNEKELPNVQDLTVGKKYMLTIEVEMTGLRKENDYASMKMPELGMATVGAKQEPPKILVGEFKITGVGMEEPD